MPQESAKPSPSEAHARAQARYRAKNPEAEKIKAKIRMQKLRQARKEATTTLSESTLPRTLRRRWKSLVSSTAVLTIPESSVEFEEFCVYMDVLVPTWIDFDDKLPGQIEEWETFLSTNPSTLDLEPCDISFVKELWPIRDLTFPEWREELADYRDFLEETTAEQRSERLKAYRAHLMTTYMIGPRLIHPPGGF
ncbi:hypothetical protein DFH09DRAFT_1332354 [Mycena vulgaris]|nr:hypothetical protein DFH09DRAFT_1332354 [Mycena vulgaris]